MQEKTNLCVTCIFCFLLPFCFRLWFEWFSIRTQWRSQQSLSEKRGFARTFSETLRRVQLFSLQLQCRPPKKNSGGPLLLSMQHYVPGGPEIVPWRSLQIILKYFTPLTREVLKDMSWVLWGNLKKNHKIIPSRFENVLDIQKALKGFTNTAWIECLEK